MWDRSFLLPLAILLGPVNADYSPYFQSSQYDNGEIGSWPTETYQSTALVGPAVNFVEYDPKCDDHLYTFLSLRGESVGNPGPVILDRHGHLVWTKDYGQTYNVDVHKYQGQDYLTFWAGDDTLGGHGDGTYYMLDSSYNEAYTIRGASILPADLHEFHITRDDTAVFTVYNIAQADLQPVGGPKRGWVWDGTFQEVNIETGELLFEWSASEHCDFTDSYQERDGTGETYEDPWDFFHINSVDKDANGNFLVSASHTNSLIYVDGQTGDIIWRLGGKSKDFKDLSKGAASNFTSQHHARFRDDDTAITLLDYSSGAARGLYVDLDLKKMTVKLRHEYENSHDLTTQSSQGSLQIVDDSGNVLIGYGLDAAWSEFTIEGDLLCQVHFGPESGFGGGDVASYRVFKRGWVGKPQSTPDLAVQGYEAAVSWNGATEVSLWVLEGANAAIPNENNEPSDHFTFLTAIRKSGFETTLSIPAGTTQIFLRARALDAKGNILGTSAVLPWDPALEEPVSTGSGDLEAETDINADENTEGESEEHPPLIDLRSFLFFVVGFTLAMVLLGSVWVIGCYRSFRSRRRRLDQEHGDWKAVGENESMGDESDSDESDIEFSLMSNPRLSPHPNAVDPPYRDQIDTEEEEGHSSKPPAERTK